VSFARQWSIVRVRNETLATWIAKRIDRKRGDVSLRADCADPDGHDQVGCAQRQLVRAGKLLTVGFGLYTRAVPARIGTRPVPPQRLPSLQEALERVGIRTYPSRALQDYNAGRTTQVRTSRVVAVHRRVRRKIGYNGTALSFERARTAARCSACRRARSGGRPLDIRERHRAIEDTSKHLLAEDRKKSAPLERIDKSLPRPRSPSCTSPHRISNTLGHRRCAAS